MPSLVITSSTKLTTATATPVLSLSVGGVDFACVADTANAGFITFPPVVAEDTVHLEFVNFTGSLRVVQSSLREAAAELVDRGSGESNCKQIMSSADITPKTSHRANKTRRPLALKQDMQTSSVLVDVESKKITTKKRTKVGVEPAKDTNKKLCQQKLNTFQSTASQATLLGQPDEEFTQTQSSLQTDADTTVELLPERVTPLHDGPSKVEQMMKNQCASPCGSLHSSDGEFHNIESNDYISPDRFIGEDSRPAGVSLGPSPLSAAAIAPCARWGHTFSLVSGNRVLLYGGQTIDHSSGNLQTLKDIYLYDLITNTWTKSAHCEGLARQWHTSTYLSERQLLITFGGETTDARGKTKITDQVRVLDTEIMLFYPPAVSGTIPKGRSGHSATLLSNELVIFGGVASSSKWLNTICLLDTTTWKWSKVSPQGVAPRPRSYHSATLINNNMIVIFGGNNAVTCFNDVVVLETSPTWRWTHPSITGVAPAPRTGHTDVLMADNHTVCIQGGWDRNTDDSESDVGKMFDGCYLLDTNTWTWRLRPAHMIGKRVGHTAIFHGNDALVFGGRVPGDQVSNQVERLAFPAAL